MSRTCLLLCNHGISVMFDTPANWANCYSCNKLNGAYWISHSEFTSICARWLILCQVYSLSELLILLWCRQFSAPLPLKPIQDWKMGLSSRMCRLRQEVWKINSLFMETVLYSLKLWNISFYLSAAFILSFVSHCFANSFPFSSPKKNICNYHPFSCQLPHPSPVTWEHWCTCISLSFACHGNQMSVFTAPCRQALERKSSSESLQEQYVARLGLQNISYQLLSSTKAWDAHSMSVEDFLVRLGGTQRKNKQ